MNNCRVCGAPMPNEASCNVAPICLACDNKELRRDLKAEKKAYADAIEFLTASRQREAELAAKVAELEAARAAVKNTIALERYLIEMLSNHYCDGHKEFCLCWTCTARRDIERDLAKLQALRETQHANQQS